MKNVETTPEALEGQVLAVGDLHARRNRGSESEAGDPKRNWSGALELISETYEAIRMADERAAAAERYSEQITRHFEDQLRAAQTRVTMAESRAAAAEARAKEAEEWLARFHDKIVEGFESSVSSQRHK